MPLSSLHPDAITVLFLEQIDRLCSPDTSPSGGLSCMHTMGHTNGRVEEYVPIQTRKMLTPENVPFLLIGMILIHALHMWILTACFYTTYLCVLRAVNQYLHTWLLSLITLACHRCCWLMPLTHMIWFMLGKLEDRHQCLTNWKAGINVWQTGKQASMFDKLESRHPCLTNWKAGIHVWQTGKQASMFDKLESRHQCLTNWKAGINVWQTGKQASMFDKLESRHPCLTNWKAGIHVWQTGKQASMFDKLESRHPYLTNWKTGIHVWQTGKQASKFDKLESRHPCLTNWKAGIHVWQTGKQASMFDKLESRHPCLTNWRRGINVWRELHCNFQRLTWNPLFWLL